MLTQIVLYLGPEVCHHECHIRLARLIVYLFVWDFSPNREFFSHLETGEAYARQVWTLISEDFFSVPHLLHGSRQICVLSFFQILLLKLSH